MGKLLIVAQTVASCRPKKIKKYKKKSRHLDDSYVELTYCRTSMYGQVAAC
mgnify:CR=1 FL=1